jgi:hypothetical protein
LSRLNHLVDVDMQPFDDAVCLGLDLDLRDRLDFAGGHHGAEHHAAFNRGQFRRVDGVCRAIESGQAVDTAYDHDHSGATNAQSAGFLHHFLGF